MKKFLFLIAAVFSSLLASQAAFAQSQIWGGVRPYVAQVVSADRSELVLIRRPSADGDAVTVYLGGEYHTSLAPGAHATICLPAGRVDAQTNLVNNGTVDNTFNDGALMLRPGATTFAVVEDVGRKRYAVRELSSDQARALLATATRQPHTISRVSRAVVCNDPTVVAKAPVAPSLPARFNFSGDTLFAFGKSGVNDLTAGGRASLDQFMETLPRTFSSIDGVRVIGYADPIGSADANQRLSAARATSVANYLAARGVSRTALSSFGQGSSELVVSNCPRAATAASIACNAPNRRVVIDVTGIRK
jgi:OOP family OmpA-OmpF porin